MKNPAIKILYVDDEVNNLTAFKSSFRKKFDIKVASTAAEAREILKTTDINVILTDVRMPKETGIQFLESIVNEFPDPIKLVVTGYSDIQAVIDAINTGQVFRYITKPWNETELGEIIEKAYKVFERKQEYKAQNEKLRRTNEELEFQLRQFLLD